jgi:lipoic acid synthetase
LGRQVPGRGLAENRHRRHEERQNRTDKNRRMSFHGAMVAAGLSRSNAPLTELPLQFRRATRWLPIYSQTSQSGCRSETAASMSERIVQTRSRKLRILDDQGVGRALADDRGRAKLPPKPDWIRAKMPTGEVSFDLRKRVAELGLHTVCESASCPNIGECWNRRSLTIMILGGICTRSCQFCDVPTGRPLPPDPDEPRRVATILAELGLRHTVITCVDRDDLADGGAAHWAATIRAVKAAAPDLVLEVLTGDFKGDTGAVDVVLAAGPDVFAHNLETVPRLSRQVRVQASYPRSYAVLRHAKSRGAIVKTGLMLGLGEEIEEIRQVLIELRQIGVDILTLGQYLRPSPGHLEIARFASPDEFAALKVEALALGFPHVESGPMVRSSYHADGQRDIVRQLAERRLAAG